MKYLKSHEAFIRQLPGRQDRVGFEIFKWPSAEVWNVTFRVKIRFEPLEQLLRELDPVGDAKDSRHFCSITRLIDNLYPKDIEYFDWQVSAEADIVAAVPAMKERVAAYGFPFFDGLPNLGALRKALATDAGDWPVPTPELRAKALTICLALEGDTAGLELWLPRLREQIRAARGAATGAQFERFLGALGARFPRLALSLACG